MIGDCRPSAMMATRMLPGAMLLSLAALLVGCDDGKIRCYPVSGQVLVDGKPTVGAMVMFVPIGGAENFQRERPYGMTNAQGEYKLTTFNKHDGAPAGEYKVMIRTMRPKSKEEAERRANSPIVAKAYRNPNTSGITASVDTGENLLEPFNLEPAASTGRQRSY